MERSRVEEVLRACEIGLQHGPLTFDTAWLESLRDLCRAYLAEHEVAKWSAHKLKGLVPQIDEDLGRMERMWNGGHPLKPCKPGTVVQPEEVMYAHMVYLRGSVRSIAEALTSSPKLEKGADDE